MGGSRMPPYAGRMARTPLTLAALATSAVADLDVTAARRAGASGSGRFDSAVLSTAQHGSLIARVPTGQEADDEQRRDMAALDALTAGARTRLPFQVPRVVGSAPYEGTQVVVYEYFAGDSGSQSLIEGNLQLALSTADAVAAIHSLPTSVVTDANLTVQSPSDTLSTLAALRDRVAATKLAPTALLARWSSALEDAALWQYHPTVVHGALGPESFVVDPPAVVAVVDWGGFRVADPASDLFWVSSFQDGSVAAAFFERYAEKRQGPADHQLRKRARLYAELEIAKWLMHGVDTQDRQVVDDAVQMLRGLEESTSADVLNPLSTDTGQVLDVAQVENLLDRTPRSASVTRSFGSHSGGITDD